MKKFQSIIGNNFKKIDDYNREQQIKILSSEKKNIKNELENLINSKRNTKKRRRKSFLQHEQRQLQTRKHIKNKIIFD